jgi:O-antigen ligase
MVTPEGQPTPLLDALIERPRPSQSAQIGWYPVKTDHAKYSGVWTFTDSGADIGWLRDSRLSFQFAGDSVALRLRQDNYVANLYVWVDGQPANALPRDAAGNAHLTLTSGSLKPEIGIVTVAQGLSEGVHTLEVIADQGFDRYALMGYAVSPGDLAAPYHAQVNVAIVTVIILTLAVGFSALGLPWSSWNARFGTMWHGLNWPVQLAIGAVTSLAIMVGTLLTWGQELPVIWRREPVLPVVALLSAGFAYVNLALPLTIGALAVLFWCIYHRFLIGLALTVIFAPFFLFPVQLYRFLFPMSEIILLVTIGAWGLHGLVTWGQMRRHGERLNLSPTRLKLTDWLVGAYVTLGALTLFWSTYTGFALTEYRTLFIEPALFYLIYRTANLTLLDRQRLVMALLLAGIAVSGISLVQYLRGETIITAEDASRRLAGVYGSPNNLALFLGRIIPFMFAALITAHAKQTRVLALMGLGLTGLTVMLTQSVGGLFIGIPAALAVVLVVAWGRRGLLGLIVVGIVVVVGFAAAASQSDRFARALDFTQGTNFYRIRVMQSAWQIIKERPLTGLGLDQFLYAFRDSYIYPDAWPEPNLSHPHNILLDFWVRLGLGGVLLLLGFIIACLISLWRVCRQWRGQAFWGWAILGMIGALVDTLIHGLLDNSIFVPDLAIVFFMLLALISSLEAAPPYGTLPTVKLT